MPTIEENKRVWNSQYDWSGAGDEWSEPWGGTQNLWQHVIYPRIKMFLPAPTIVEIAPGFGRWTQFLRQHCERLIGVDITPKCVESCKSRFADSPHVQIAQNDGRTIPIAADASVDFVFSFDSLVHAEADTLQAYLQEIARVLKPSGAGFVHHSNLGQYRRLRNLSKRFPPIVVKAGEQINIFPKANWRAESVSARWFLSVVQELGMSPVKQELINWRNRLFLTDCLTTLRRSPGVAKEVLCNRRFMHQAEQIRLSYGRRGEPNGNRAN